MEGRLGMEGRSLVSRTISCSRFPLALMVVLSHANIVVVCSTLSGGDFECPWASRFVMDMLSFLGRSLVNPMYFAISGFLFFLRVEDFNRETYRRKLRRRVGSLLVPYLIWNFLAFAYKLAKQWAGLGDMALPNDLQGWTGFFLSAFWQFGDEGPADMPLWFVRNLMVVVLFTPVIHRLVRCRLAGLYILSLVAWFLLCGRDMPPGLDPSAFLYFSIGACLSTRKVNVAAMPRWLGMASIAGTLSLMVLYAVALRENDGIWLYFLGNVFSVTASHWLLLRRAGRGPSFLEGSFLKDGSFFVFAFHAFIIGAIMRAFHALMDLGNAVEILVAYFLTIVLSAFVSLLVYFAVDRLFPRLARVLVGKAFRGDASATAGK